MDLLFSSKQSHPPTSRIDTYICLVMISGARLLASSSSLYTRRLSTTLLRNNNAPGRNNSRNKNEPRLEDADLSEKRQFTHPLTKVAADLRANLSEHQQDLDSVFSKFKDEIAKLSHRSNANENDEKVGAGNDQLFKRSFSLNIPLLTLLTESSNSPNTNVDPYQILNTLCEYDLARPQHFEIVFTHLLKQGNAKDAVALWVRYLETMSTNPFMAKGSDFSQSNNIALVTAAYLILPGVNPDYSMLIQILQQSENKNFQFQLVKINRLIHTLLKNAKQRDLALEAFGKLVQSFAKADKAAFIRHIRDTDSTNWNNLKELYKYYHENFVTNPDSAVFDSEILLNFMDQFIVCNKAMDAIRVYNDFKSVSTITENDVLLLKNHLLIAVGKMDVPILSPNKIKDMKLERILAVWNSLIKGETNGSKPNEESYNSLFKAMIISENFHLVKVVYENELPETFKTNKNVYETYLLSLLKSKKYSYDNLLEDVAKVNTNICTLETIESIDLINAVLLKLVEEKPQSKFDALYDNYFTSATAKKKSPSSDTMAIKLWANYKHKNSDDFNFLKSISQPASNLSRVNHIAKKFIEIVPEIGPINEFFVQIREPLNVEKYSLFISAQFKNLEGDYALAESLFKTYIEEKFKKSNSKFGMVGKLLIEPIIEGFCILARHETDPNFILKLNTYSEFASRIGYTLPFQILARMLSTMTLVSKNSKLSVDQKETFQSLLEKISKIKGFNMNPNDLTALSKAGVVVPKKSL